MEQAVITTAAQTLLLASTSVHRRELLARFRLPFECVAPAVDEARLAGEAPEALATRLARAKALAVARQRADAVVIGSDQVALRGEDLLGKPGDAERCRAQLVASSGRELLFVTAVCVASSGGSRCVQHMDRTRVLLRRLNRDEIARYVERDRPWDCAAGFKVESLGIALCERVETVDPSALIGLPLIWLAGVLRSHGFAVP
jgi:septum formation protein